MRPSVPTSVLLDATASLVAEAGLEALRMDSVAARAGVAKGVPYGRFASKTDLVVAMIDRELVLAMRHAAELVQADPAGGSFARMWAHSVAALHSRPALLRLYTSAGPLAAVAGERSSRTGDRALIGADFLRELQTAGVLMRDVDVDAMAANLALWNHALAAAAPHDDLDRLIDGMARLLQGIDTGAAPDAGKAVFARFVEALIADRA